MAILTLCQVYVCTSDSKIRSATSLDTTTVCDEVMWPISTSKIPTNIQKGALVVFWNDQHRRLDEQVTTIVPPICPFSDLFLARFSKDMTLVDRDLPSNFWQCVGGMNSPSLSRN